MTLLLSRAACRRVPLALALWLALVPTRASVHVPRGQRAEASEGSVGTAMHPAAEDPARTRARRRLAEDGQGTYIHEMLLTRDSALARWPDRRGAPLRVWVQPVAAFDDWNVAYVREVRAAFREWDALHLPVRFAFVGDSARADVHVSFVDRFREQISGRTRWVRDDDWWITDADIMLATHHRNGDVLDADAMRAMTLHEVGHLLGLDHTADDANIMAPRVRVRSLSSADRATVRLLYALPAGAIR